jgi:hypothetical protein
MINQSKHQDKLWDTASIGFSTISANFETVRPKISSKKQLYDNNQELHVVPSGGAKARATSSNHPYPCRYDKCDI